MGIVHKQVRVSDIVIGDLPTSALGCFYVEFEVGEHPVQRSSVSPLKDPRTVEIPGDIILSVRDNTNDNDVRMVVKKMRSLGSQEVCHIHISPWQLLRWAEHTMDAEKERGQMRLRMEQCSTWILNEFQSAPWIFMQLDIWDVRCAGQGATMYRPLGSNVTIVDSEAGTQEPMNFLEFRGRYPMRDHHGSTLKDPFKTGAAEYDDYKRMKSRRTKCCCCLFILAFVIVCGLRLAMYTCWRRYRRMVVLDLHAVTFPVDAATDEWVHARCGTHSDLWALFTDVHIKRLKPLKLRKYNVTRSKAVYDTMHRVIVSRNSSACHPDRNLILAGCWAIHEHKLQGAADPSGVGFFRVPISTWLPTYLPALQCHPRECEMTLYTDKAWAWCLLLLAAWAVAIVLLWLYWRRMVRESFSKMVKLQSYTTDEEPDTAKGAAPSKRDLRRAEEFHPAGHCAESCMYRPLCWP